MNASHQAFAHNTSAVLAALRQHNCGAVSIEYSGYGDSGDRFDVYGEIPKDATVTMAINEQDPTQTETLPLHEAIEQLGFALTEAFHGGYEINEGGGGMITFSPHGYIDIDAYSYTEYVDEDEEEEPERENFQVFVLDPALDAEQIKALADLRVIDLDNTEPLTQEQKITLEALRFHETESPAP